MLSRDVEWTWKDRENNRHRPADMKTSHVFFTLRMIWNHSMPEEVHVGGTVNRYRFGPFYTVEYMKRAVVELVSELDKRNDLAPHLKMQLDQMKSHFGPRGLAEAVGV